MQVAADLLAVVEDPARRGAGFGEQLASGRGRLVAGLLRVRRGFVAQLAGVARALGAQLRGLGARLRSDLERLVVGGLDAHLGGPVGLGDPVGGALLGLVAQFLCRALGGGDDLRDAHGRGGQIAGGAARG